MEPISLKFKTNTNGNIINIWSLYLDTLSNKEILWAGCEGGGLVGIDLQTKQQIQFNHDAKNPNSISNYHVGAIYKDSEEEIWIGPWEGGVNKINLKTGLVVKYNFNPKNPKSLSNDIVFAIFRDSKKRLWVGTNDGLNFYLPGKKGFRRFKEKEGLGSAKIVADGITEDEKGNIWVINKKTISKLNPEDFSFQNYDSRDGFSNKIDPRVFTNGDKAVFVYGQNGITEFKTNEIKDNQRKPPIVITDFRIYNKSIFEKNKEYSRGSTELVLSYDQSFFSIDFSALNFILPQKNQYAYKLEGFDKDWVYSRDIRTANYTSVPPGNYTFKVRGCHNDFIWNNTPTELKITITPPFWKTTWFQLTALFSIVTIAVSFYRYKLNSIKKQKRLLESLVEERTSELQDANEELTTQSERITELYGEIKDSIRAAEVLQASILPSDNFIRKYLPDSFVLNRPKDVVSGDFYWFDVIDDKIIIAAVGCTGHGVSGAFMSIIGHSLLNQAVLSSKQLTASEILNLLNDGIMKVLHREKDNENIQDGMDVALCVIDKERRKVHFAGAINPLYISRGDEIIQVKGDRFPIGLTVPGINRSFKNNELELQEKDILYIFSDGYCDQFGGENGDEKFMYSRFRNLLVEIREENMQRQPVLLENSLLAWRRSTEQLDDILVIGFKV